MQLKSGHESCDVHDQCRQCRCHRLQRHSKTSSSLSLTESLRHSLTAPTRIGSEELKDRPSEIQLFNQDPHFIVVQGLCDHLQNAGNQNTPSCATSERKIQKTQDRNLPDTRPKTGFRQQNTLFTILPQVGRAVSSMANKVSPQTFPNKNTQPRPGNHRGAHAS